MSEIHPTLGEILAPTLTEAPGQLVLDDRGRVAVVVLHPLASIAEIAEAWTLQTALNRGPLVIR